MKEKRTHFEIRTAALKRAFMWYFLSKSLDCVLVSEYPKSGGTWLSQMLSDTLNLPFPMGVSPKFESCILHGHFIYNRRFHNMIGLVRDGRDVMVSAYYHFLFNNEKNPSFEVDYHRSKLNFDDYHNIKSNLPLFIEYLFEEFNKGVFHFTWTEHVMAIVNNHKVIMVKYEDLLQNSPKELSRIVSSLGRTVNSDEIFDEVAKTHAFENRKSSVQSEQYEMSFLRKGIHGDWQKHFSKEARELFHKYGGKALIQLGYEVNSNWVNQG